MRNMINMMFYEVSAYTGSNIDNAFKAIVYEVLKPVENFVKKFK